jgi:hypothetical protein
VKGYFFKICQKTVYLFIAAGICSCVLPGTTQSSNQIFVMKPTAIYLAAPVLLLSFAACQPIPVNSDIY